jgi:hypothetical protein
VCFGRQHKDITILIYSKLAGRISEGMDDARA